MKTFLRSFAPQPLNTHPGEWLRAAIGASVGMFISALLSQWLFGMDLTLHLLGPMAASAVLLFAVSTGALAQPWSIIGGYLVSALVAVACVQGFGNTLTAVGIAAGASILLMCVCRCLHPPGAAIAACIISSQQSLSALGVEVLYPVTFNAGCLLAIALIYNNLTRIRYPATRSPSPAAHAAAATTGHQGVSSEDLSKALEEADAFVDVSRDELEAILRRAQAHALQRNRPDIDTSRQNADIGH